MVSSSIENWQRAGFGVYVHWPFCAAKCPYCDFNSHVASEVDHDQWLAAFIREIDRYAAEVPGRVVSSIFFGGGTPSLMDPSVVAAIIDHLAATWRFSNAIEITLEANPTSVEHQKFSHFANAGVNRVSVGVQALNDTDLQRLGRQHSAHEARRAVEIAQGVFSRASFDLIYARQGQSVHQWEKELSDALDIVSGHISLYQLTIEKGTVFGHRHARGKLSGVPSDDVAADMFQLTQDMCDEAGLIAYEVSNHASAGQESVHNQIYWQCGDYLGLGPGAHGRLSVNDTRVATEAERLPKQWLARTDSMGGEILRDVLTTDDVLSERLVMGLRTNIGATLTDAERQKINPRALASLLEDQLVEQYGSTLRTTRRGRMVLNAVLSKLV